MAVLGGYKNGSGDVTITYHNIQPTPYYTVDHGTDHSVGQYATVTSGMANLAIGTYSSISGGLNNEANE